MIIITTHNDDTVAMIIKYPNPLLFRYQSKNSNINNGSSNLPEATQYQPET